MKLDKEPAIKTPDQYTFIGTPMPRMDVPHKINGAAKFGMDAQVEGMVFAAINASPVPGGKLKLHILAEAGTYIKEFIHSDDGRTTPSVSSVLKCCAACDSLDVVGIHDYFLETVKE